ncbi:hypothetical protein FF38_00796 [Lucilia cuprina]|uniref:Uncharacterized protein n=1 Tax=Lucilia cuprina TaxID=7375 RepID=A0A0L0C1B6_LUCCU|nr:hypothetical protein FF38_00796 [Lucilia cuprina]
MERKPTMPRKIMPKVKAEKPSAFQPPPEARPRIISDIQIRPPPAHAQPPPPLSYLTPVQRRVRIARTTSTPVATSPLTPEAPKASIPTSRATAEAPRGPVLSAQPIPTIISGYASDEVPTTSKSAPVLGNNRTAAPKTPRPKARRYPKYTEEQVFENIKINKPRKYTKHKQYLIHRPSFPPLKVTILNRNFARLRCQGHCRVVAMVAK